jgi:hypothetical protein
LAIAQRWGYNPVFLTWSADDRDWVSQDWRGEDIWGFYTILDHWGHQGYELVSVQPYRWNTPGTFGGLVDSSGTYEETRTQIEPGGIGYVHGYRTLQWEVTVYLCIFKLPHGPLNTSGV